MTLQVVNPATGEIATMTSSSNFNRMVCIKAAEKFAMETGQRWDVVEINVIHIAEPITETKGNA